MLIYVYIYFVSSDIHEKRLRLGVFFETRTAICPRGQGRADNIGLRQPRVVLLSLESLVPPAPTGSIPEELGDLSELRELFLDHNELIGKARFGEWGDQCIETLCEQQDSIDGRGNRPQGPKEGCHLESAPASLRG